MLFIGLYRFVLEAASLGLLLLLAFARPALGARFARRAARWFRAQAARKIQPWALAAAVFAAGSAVSLWLDPKPLSNDEFSYLLAADTFHHGRLANPVHPLREFFETYHTLHGTTYASKFPPAQGVMLWLGRLIFDRAILGNALSGALTAVALRWMLIAWLPVGWATLAAWLTMLPLAVFSYWGQSYWGGFVAMTGGCLVAGAVERLRQRVRTRDTLLLGAGLLVLAHSRPFEGAIYSALWLAALAVSLWRRRSETAWLGRVALPLLGCGVVIAGSIAYYNLRVTGRPMLFPHQAYESHYNTTPIFLGGKIRPFNPELRALGPTYERFVRVEEGWYAKAHAHLLLDRLQNLGGLWIFFIAPLLTFPLLFLKQALRRPRIRLAAAILLTFLAVQQMILWYFPHYTAPAAGLFALVIFQCLRYLRVARWRGRAFGAAYVRWWPVAQAAVLIVSSVLCTHGVSRELWYMAWSLDSSSKAYYRHQAEAFLEGQPGRHLVLVRYASDFPPPSEFVHNAAAIDESRIVWARYDDESRLPKLLDYYRDRSYWILNCTKDGVELDRFVPPASATQRSAGIVLPTAIPSAKYTPLSESGRMSYV